MSKLQGTRYGKPLDYALALRIANFSQSRITNYLARIRRRNRRRLYEWAFKGRA